MKILIYVTIIIYIFYSCSGKAKTNKKPLIVQEMSPINIKNDSINSNQDTFIKIDNDLQLIQNLNSLWIRYYTSKIKNFSYSQFTLMEEKKESKLITGNIFGDYEKEFNQNHSQFLINSKDNSQYIDLDSYQMNIEKNHKGELICSGVEIDQEVNWINRKTKEIKRLTFVGSTTLVEDAIWLNKDVIALLGVSDNKLFIEIINLKTLVYKTFINPNINLNSTNFHREIRLKKVKMLE